MTTVRAFPRIALAVLGVALSTTACGDDPPAAAPTTPAAGTPAAGGAAAPGAATGTRPANAANAAQQAPPPPMAITDQTFVESAAVRDPFRSYAREFISSAAMNVTETRDVKLRNFSLDDLRLVAVVVGSDAPYAMVVDPSRAGTILRRGMLVGRQEVIHSSIQGAQDYPAHWRVSRITGARLRRLGDGTFEEVPAELVFERPDPLNPNAPIVERSLALAPSQNAPGSSGGGGPSALPPALNPLLPGGGNAYLPPNLSGLGGGAQGAPIPQNLQGAPGTTSTTTVYNVTQPAPAAAQPTTIVVQPPAPPPGGGGPSNAPPPVVITGGGALPAAGLGQ